MVFGVVLAPTPNTWLTQDLGSVRAPGGGGLLMAKNAVVVFNHTGSEQTTEIGSDIARRIRAQ